MSRKWPTNNFIETCIHDNSFSIEPIIWICWIIWNHHKGCSHVICWYCDPWFTICRASGREPFQYKFISNYTKSKFHHQANVNIFHNIACLRNQWRTQDYPEMGAPTLQEGHQYTILLRLLTHLTINKSENLTDIKRNFKAASQFKFCRMCVL